MNPVPRAPFSETKVTSILAQLKAYYGNRTAWWSFAHSSAGWIIEHPSEEDGEPVAFTILPERPSPGEAFSATLKAFDRFPLARTGVDSRSARGIQLVHLLDILLQSTKEVFHWTKTNGHIRLSIWPKQKGLPSKAASTS